MLLQLQKVVRGGWQAKLGFAIAATSTAVIAGDFEIPTEAETAWLAKHAPDGFDIYADGIWITAGTDANGTTYGIRLRDIIAPGQTSRVFWLRADHGKDKTTPYRSTKMKISISCERQTISQGTVAHYLADGNVYANKPWENYPGPGGDIVPGSMADHWSTIACWSD